MPSTLTVPVQLIVDVHEIDGGGFYGEVRHVPGCLAQADSLDGLAEAIREAVRDYFAEPLNRLFQNTLLSVLLVGAIFVLLAMLFARSIVKPIEKLTSAAHALKSGDYANANIAVKSNDEVGQLARTFNVMIDVLRQRERERSGRRSALGYDQEES